MKCSKEQSIAIQGLALLVNLSFAIDSATRGHFSWMCFFFVMTAWCLFWLLAAFNRI